jgi:uncharacterized protein YqgC (DUF456 family)
MSGLGELLIGLAMAVGLVGILIPVLPGIVLVWLAGLAWTILDGGGIVRWSLFGVMTALTLGALVAGVRLPTKSAAHTDAPRGTLWLAAAFSIVGFFVIPVIGVLVGFSAGVLLAHLIATNDIHKAFDALWATLRAFGKSVLIHGACGVGICTLWILGLIVT